MNKKIGVFLIGIMAIAVIVGGIVYVNNKPETELDVEVSGSSVVVGLNENFNVSSLELTGLDTSGCSIAFSDGTADKVFEALGSREEDITITGESGLRKVFHITFEVVDKESPVISGLSDKEIVKGQPLDLSAGVIATDNSDGDVTDKLNIGGVDTGLTGVQTVFYEVTDSSGNKGTASVNVVIKDEPVEACNKTVYVKGTTVNIRSDASVESSIIATLNYRDSVKVTGVVSDWLKVDYNGQTGYVSSGYVSDTQPEKKTVKKTAKKSSSSSGGDTAPKKSSSETASNQSSADDGSWDLGIDWSQVKTHENGEGTVSDVTLSDNPY